ncbi:hypothetical protein [Pseudomonas sp. LB3P25]|jgi:hypothetical protein
MKTFNAALHVLRSASHLFRDLPRVSFLFFTGSIPRLLCVERNGALVCCIPGAPIVRLPRH